MVYRYLLGYCVPYFFHFRRRRTMAGCAGGKGEGGGGKGGKKEMPAKGKKGVNPFAKKKKKK